MSFKSRFIKQAMFTSVLLPALLLGVTTTSLASEQLVNLSLSIIHETGKAVYCDASSSRGNAENQCLTAMRNVEKALLTFQPEEMDYFDVINFFSGDQMKSGVFSETGTLELNISLSSQQIIDVVKAVPADVREVQTLKRSLMKRLNIYTSCNLLQRLSVKPKPARFLGHRLQLPFPVVYKFTPRSCVNALRRLSDVLDRDPGFEAWLRDQSHFSIIVLGMKNTINKWRDSDQAWIDISYEVSDAALKKEFYDTAAAQGLK
jgi:hypothetical protein